jgi:cell shape-determining protein MreC
MFEYESLVAENAALREKIAKMESDARKADSVARENDRLRAMNGWLSTREGYEVVDCYIIS